MKMPCHGIVMRLFQLATAFGLTALLTSCPGGAQTPVQQETPARHHIAASSLPAPYATPSARNFPYLSPRPDGAALHVPRGFTISEWTTGLSNPRFLTVAPNGDVFVAESQANRVSVLRPSPSGMRVAKRAVFADGLRQPFGIAF